MDIVEMIQQAYTQVADDMCRIDLTNEDGVFVKAYRVGLIIRIDIRQDGARELLTDPT